MQFDAILKPKKANRQKKRKKDDEEILDRFADEEVSRLREAMLGAAADDEQANRDKLPATNKLKLLPQVMEVLRKYAVTFLFCHYDRSSNNIPQAIALTVHCRQQPFGRRPALARTPPRSIPPSPQYPKRFFPHLKTHGIH